MYTMCCQAVYNQSDEIELYCIDVPPPNGLEVATTIQEPRPTLNAHLAKGW